MLAQYHLTVAFNSNRITAGSINHFELKIYEAANPATLLYHASNAGTVRIQ